MRENATFKKRPTLKRVITIPIWDVDLLIVVSDSTADHVAIAASYLGSSFAESDFGSASSMYRDDKFASFFLRQRLSHRHVAHELLHNTVRILDYCGVKLDTNNHETHAYLNDYLHHKVYALLKTHKEAISNEP